LRNRLPPVTIVQRIMPDTRGLDPAGHSETDERVTNERVTNERVIDERVIDR
jgi:hypothetical protein